MPDATELTTFLPLVRIGMIASTHSRPGLSGTVGIQLGHVPGHEQQSASRLSSSSLSFVPRLEIRTGGRAAS
jgi:hypothetical protein